MFVCYMKFYFCCLVAKLYLTFATPCTVAHQAILSYGFPRQEYWSRLSFPSARDRQDLIIKLVSPALQAGSLSLNHQGSLNVIVVPECPEISTYSHVWTFFPLLFHIS